jgi:SAM-dependent methyltransferase
MLALELGRRLKDFAAFAEAERIGWTDAERASGYVDLFAAASDQVIEPLLDSVGAKSGQNVLDLCCGQGNVAEGLAVRGCNVTGVDFSPAMLEFARRRLPDAVFIEADAQALPFRDAEFDVVVSNVGVCHVPDQRRALAEAKRVLRQGGRRRMMLRSRDALLRRCGAVSGALRQVLGPKAGVDDSSFFVTTVLLSRFRRPLDFGDERRGRNPLIRLGAQTSSTISGGLVRALSRSN